MNGPKPSLLATLFPWKRRRDGRSTRPTESASGGRAAGGPNEELQARLDKLLDAANTASGHVRNVYLTFLLFGLYLGIIFGATTHEQLLRESPVTLPLLNVELPLLGFYWVAPALFVLLHLNLLLQLYLLSGKLHRLDQAIGPPPARTQETEAQQDRRAQLYPFPFSHMLVGRQHGRLMRLLLWLIVWLTVLVLPVVLMLAGQIRFLPYHDAATTTWHRTLVAADVFLILIFWRPIRHPEDRLSAHPGRWLWHQGKALPGTLAALALSWLILTFPGDESSDWGDPMEELVLSIAPEGLIDRVGAQPMLWPTRYLFERLPFLERNLVAREVNLVDNWPTQDQIKQHGEDLAWQNFGKPPNLRGRDLRHANVSRSIFVRGDFRGANLQGAVLRHANLQGAELFGANLQGADFQYANLRAAKLGSADFQGADFQHANLRDVMLGGRDLRGTMLQYADLVGARLYDTNLQNMLLAYVNFSNANLRGANLEMADLTGAKLQGTDLQGAKLQTASLRQAHLQGAILKNLNLSGVDLWNADLNGADLEGAILLGANLSEAGLQGTNLKRAKLQGAGFGWCGAPGRCPLGRQPPGRGPERRPSLARALG